MEVDCESALGKSTYRFISILMSFISFALGAARSLRLLEYKCQWRLASREPAAPSAKLTKTAYVRLHKLIQYWSGTPLLRSDT